MKNIALLLIDIQNDYFPGGKVNLPDSIKAAENARKVLQEFRNNNLPIIHIQHLSVRPGATFFIPDTTGTDIHITVKPENGETSIKKNFPNSFRETQLKNFLDQWQINRLVIAGMMTQMCVDATTREAFDLGFECTVVTDACAANSLEWNKQKISAETVHNSFIAALSGIYARIITASETSTIILINH